MKRTNNLDSSDYTNIWKVIIYLLFAEHIASANRETNLFTRFRKFRALKDAIDAYYSHAFSPEIINALQFVESSGSSAKILAKYAEAGMDEQARYELNASQFQTNLLFIQKQFQDAFTSLKLSFDYLLFIDGIDIRPNSIDYADYLQCIRGLANAVWSVNSDFFPSIRDSKGRLRTILLVRPDIFSSLGLQNRNTKLRDNSVLLDWRTNYETYRSSAIFEITDRMLRVQQNVERMAGETWDHYFPFDATSVRSEQMLPSAFIIFLRYSFYRPRGVITMLSILQSVHLSRTENAESVFSYDELMSPEFRNPYSDYLLGEVRDQLVFYYSDMDFDAFLKFFQFLYGMTRFDYEAYVNAFAEWEGWMDNNLEERPDFAASAEGFLQFLYDLNVVSFTEEAEDECSGPQL